MSDHHGAPSGPSRRAFLRSAGLAGAGAAVLGSLSAASATGRSGGDGRWDPDPAGPQFTLAIMPDTQFLYWGSQNSIDPEPQEESFRYVIGSADDNIVFLAHLGDLTQDGDATSFAAVGKTTHDLVGSTSRRSRRTSWPRTRRSGARSPLSTCG